MRWEITTLLLCIYGFMKEFRPSEPYLYEYEHVTLNISEHTLNSKVYPIWTYSYLTSLVPVFLLTDVLLYKPVIIVEALSYVTVWILFVFFGSVVVQQIIEVFYGIATATEVAYFSYIYVKVPRKHFKRVTSLTRAALQLGRFAGYLTGQLIILFGWGSYRTLNWVSLVSLILALLFSLFLPSVSWKAAYQKKIDHLAQVELVEEDQSHLSDASIPSESNSSISEEGIPSISIDQKQIHNDSQETSHKLPSVSYRTFVVLHLKGTLRDVIVVYRDLFVSKWSLWWALASCANFQIANYAQTLWGTMITSDNHDVYNGFTEAACPLLAVPAVLLMHRLRVDWPRWGELCLSFFCLVDGFLLLLLARSHHLGVMYGGYIAYEVIFQGIITIAQFNIAERISSLSFGVVFGLNTFVALLLQSILTFVVVSENGLALTIRPQQLNSTLFLITSHGWFVVYAGYHFAMSVIFAIPVVISVVRCTIKRCSNEKTCSSDTVVSTTQTSVSTVSEIIKL